MTPAAAGYTLEVSEELFMLINHHHAERPGEHLVLTPAQVCDLAGCAAQVTAEILADPQAMAALAEADEAIARGDVIRGTEAVRALRPEPPGQEGT